ncbi:MAG: GGDEF domain-containing protein [Desulfobacterales bacterium]|nr:GGDEF domain-containing protein [Desulfobacterales bacterium]
MLENLLFESHFDIIPFNIYVVDIVTYQIIYMNRHFKEKRGDHTGEYCYKALYQIDRPCTFCKIKSIVDYTGKPNGKTYVFEHFNDVDDRWYQVQEKAISWPDGRIVKYSIAVDITELKETQNRLAEAHADLALKRKELEILSVTDKLTGVYNRLKLDELLNNELDRANRYGNTLSILLMDIDHFKEVNDTYGHQCGDKVLIDIANILKDRIRKTDFVGRWGGEEFLIICTETNLSDAHFLAEGIRKIIETYNFPIAGSKTVSFGVTERKPDDTIEHILARADAALYRAKNAGRNRTEND